MLPPGGPHKCDLDSSCKACNVPSCGLLSDAPAEGWESCREKSAYCDKSKATQAAAGEQFFRVNAMAFREPARTPWNFRWDCRERKNLENTTHSTGIIKDWCHWAHFKLSHQDKKTENKTIVRIRVWLSCYSADCGNAQLDLEKIKSPFSFHNLLFVDVMCELSLSGFFPRINKVIWLVYFQ